VARTLVDSEIQDAATMRGLITPFDPARLKGASYDFRIGDTLILAHPEGLRGVSLAVQRSFSLQPGQFCMVASLEKIKVPSNMIGRLSLRSFHQLRGLSYSGGMIDPGYNGLLFFPLVNISDSAIQLTYQDALVTCEFEYLDREATRLYKEGEEITKPQQTPPLPARLPYNVLDLSNRIDGLNELCSQIRNEIRKLETAMGVTQRIQEFVFLGSLAAIVAAAFLLLFAKLPPSLQPLVASAAIIVSLALLLFRRSK